MLTEIQHSYYQLILSTMHLHLTTITPGGPGSSRKAVEVRKVAESLISVKGVNTAA